MNDFKEVRENIIDMLEGLDEQLSEIIEEGSKSEGSSKQTLKDKTYKAENNSLLNSLWDKTHNEMDKIKRSISQIGSGSYGVCLDCGQPIKKEQSTKIALSSLCPQCAKKEKEGKN